MRIEVDIRDSEVGVFLRTVESDQLPFATSLAINWTALEFQKRERSRLHDIFTIRRRSFAERSIKIRRGDFTTKTKPEATVRVDSPRGRSHIFTKFETDTSKRPFRGRSIAVPTENVPRTGTGIIPKRWRPRSLLEKARQRRRGRRAFLIRRPGGRGTIFQRINGDIFALYQLVPRVSIDPELKFEVTARSTVRDVWAANFTRAFDRAIGIR